MKKSMLVGNMWQCWCTAAKFDRAHAAHIRRSTSRLFLHGHSPALILVSCLIDKRYKL